MRRSSRRVSKKPGTVEVRRLPAERLAERVFVESPRSFSFSHRSPASLRHPCLPLVVDMIEAAPSGRRVDRILQALLEAKSDTDKWKRVAAVFDNKMSEKAFDDARMNIMTNPEVMRSIESLWNALGGKQDTLLTIDIYRQFHVRLYSILLGAEDISFTAATSATVNDDFNYDARGEMGVSFGAFALSMLEIADNWTKSRTPADHAALLADLAQCFETVARRPSYEVVDTTNFTLSDNVFFSGGVVAKHQRGNYTEYAKVPM